MNPPRSAVMTSLAVAAAGGGGAGAALGGGAGGGGDAAVGDSGSGEHAAARIAQTAIAIDVRMAQLRNADTQIVARESRAHDSAARRSGA
jgi:hypothetical protein